MITLTNQMSFVIFLAIFIIRTMNMIIIKINNNQCSLLLVTILMYIIDSQIRRHVGLKGATLIC